MHKKEYKEDLEITQTYNSNAIEGNTLSLAETKAVLLHGVTIEGKPLKDHLEAINHVYAMRYIDKLAFDSNKELKEPDILEIHKLILTDIRPEDAGAYRKINVRAGGSWRKFPKPEEVKELMDNFIKDKNQKRIQLKINYLKNGAGDRNRTYDPLITNQLLYP